MLDRNRLKTCRKECKLTQQQVADLLNIDRSAYAYYELGVSSPSVENLFKLAVIFKVEAEWLMGMSTGKSNLRSPEGDLSLLKAVREKNITELTKDERQIVALYRLVNAKGKADIMMQAINDVLEEN